MKTLAKQEGGESEINREGGSLTPSRRNQMQREKDQFIVSLGGKVSRPAEENASSSTHVCKKVERGSSKKRKKNPNLTKRKLKLLQRRKQQRIL